MPSPQAKTSDRPLGDQEGDSPRVSHVRFRPSWPQDDRLYPLWRLAATTGMRRGEVLGLRWQWLDVEASTLLVEQQLVPTRGGVSFGSPKSKRSRRTISLD
jgi:integrase